MSGDQVWHMAAAQGSPDPVIAGHGSDDDALQADDVAHAQTLQERSVDLCLTRQQQAAREWLCETRWRIFRYAKGTACDGKPRPFSPSGDGFCLFDELLCLVDGLDFGSSPPSHDGNRRCGT